MNSIDQQYIENFLFELRRIATALEMLAVDLSTEDEKEPRVKGFSGRND